MFSRWQNLAARPNVQVAYVCKVPHGSEHGKGSVFFRLSFSAFKNPFSSCLASRFTHLISYPIIKWFPMVYKPETLGNRCERFHIPFSKPRALFVQWQGSYLVKVIEQKNTFPSSHCEDLIFHWIKNNKSLGVSKKLISYYGYIFPPPLPSYLSPAILDNLLSRELGFGWYI